MNVTYQPPGRFQDQHPYASAPLAPVPPETNGPSGMSIAAFVLGLMTNFCCLTIFGAIPALIIGWMEKNKINRNESSPKGYGFAVAGIVLAVIHLAWLTLVLIYYLIFGLAVLAQLAQGS